MYVGIQTMYVLYVVYVCIQQVSEAISFSTSHAQVTMLRGKRKHLCDFSLEVSWQLELLGATPTPTTLQGTLQVTYMLTQTVVHTVIQLNPALMVSTAMRTVMHSMKLYFFDFFLFRIIHFTVMHTVLHSIASSWINNFLFFSPYYISLFHFLRL